MSESELRRFDAKERQRQAIQLKMAGASYTQIADQLGYASASGAHAAVKRAMEEVPNEEVDSLRQVDNARLNQMLLGVWGKAQKGDFGAIDRALKIMERMAKLNGVDAPTKSEITNIGGGTTNIGTIVIDGNKDSYIQALRKARGELVDEDIIDAEIIEEPSSVPSSMSIDGNREPMEGEDDAEEG